MKENKVYSSLDVARYIINYSIDNNYEISNLKLQKILYYVQSAFLVFKKKRCFYENIINWAYGPVIEEVYREYRECGYESIPRQDQYSRIVYDDDEKLLKFETQNFNKDSIDNEDKTLINKVVDSYSKYTPFQLVNKTHSEGPWKETCQNQVISCDIIQKFYLENEKLIYGKEN